MGKLEIDADWPDQAQRDGFVTLPVTWRHAAVLQELPFITVRGRQHRDPFDRLLIAQAMTERVPIVTADAAIAAHGIPVVW